MPLIKELLIIFLIYYWLIAVCAAESGNLVKIKTRPCNKGREFDVQSKHPEIFLGPCPATGKCELYKGSNASITVKFTPTETFSGPNGCKLKSKLAWLSKIEMDFGGISPSACDHMGCPLEANKETIFNATFMVSKMYPTGSYPVKLRIWQSAGEKQVVFCRLFKVHLTGQPANVVDNMLT